jgi:hypothetical protein
MAMKEEYQALIENKMWDLMSCPSNTDIIQILWAVRHKNKYDRSFKRYKSHLVGSGVG